EDLGAPHAPVPDDRVRLRIAEHRPHVQRPADGRRRRVDRIDLLPRLRPVEPVRPVGVPPLAPARFEPVETRLLRDAGHAASLRKHVAVALYGGPVGGGRGGLRRRAQRGAGGGWVGPVAVIRRRGRRIPPVRVSAQAVRRVPVSVVTSVGVTRSRTTVRSITHWAMSERLGRSYITSRSTSSRIALRPRAPVPRLSASSPTASSASSENTRSTSSNWKNFWYCFSSAFFGSTRIRMSASW